MIHPAKPQGHNESFHDHPDETCVVLSGFPDQPREYLGDIRPLLDQAKLHGQDEWKACVLTSELHRHLGVYAIIGAKMGIFALECLRISTDEVTITAHTGIKPPLSCLLDGLQASTGATLGHGMIVLAEGGDPYPQADFTHNGTTVRLRLKAAVYDRIRNDFSGILARFTPERKEYWSEIRALALKYWAELDRKDIFDIISLHPEAKP
jgi:pyrimidine-specific ribonucleoside hydrolase